jgi:hypothetical protein
VWAVHENEVVMVAMAPHYVKVAAEAVEEAMLTVSDVGSCD